MKSQVKKFMGTVLTLVFQHKNLSFWCSQTWVHERKFGGNRASFLYMYIKDSWQWIMLNSLLPPILFLWLFFEINFKKVIVLPILSSNIIYSLMFWYFSSFSILKFFVLAINFYKIKSCSCYICFWGLTPHLHSTKGFVGRKSILVKELRCNCFILVMYHYMLCVWSVHCQIGHEWKSEMLVSNHSAIIKSCKDYVGGACALSLIYAHC